MDAVTVLNKKINLYTDAGLLRIRYLIIIGTLVPYVAFNMLTFAIVADGGKGHVNRVAHAPLISAFGQ